MSHKIWRTFRIKWGSSRKKFKFTISVTGENSGSKGTKVDGPLNWPSNEGLFIPKRPSHCESLDHQVNAQNTVQFWTVHSHISSIFEYRPFLKAVFFADRPFSQTVHFTSYNAPSLVYGRPISVLRTVHFRLHPQNLPFRKSHGKS